MSNPSYWLPEHVYVCRIRDAAILLDVRNDKYHGLQGEQMQALGAVVHGWPVSGHPGPLAFAENIASQLLAKGLLTRNAGQGKSASPVVLRTDQLPVAVGPDVVRPRSIRPRDIFNFVRAWIWGATHLRRGLLEQCIRTLESEKQRQLRSGGAFDEDTTIELVTTFRRLRCYAFVARERCLLHALVLTRFLSFYGIHPTFVMGVRTAPWGAHSWVQHGSLILDAHPAQTRDFTPILAV